MVRVKRFRGIRRCFRKSLVNLQEDTLILLLQYLPVADLCKMRLVCRRFNNLILNSPSLWVHTSFSAVWPSPENFHIFQRASEAGNIEAIIKLGISYLYNEGVSSNSSKKISLSLNEKNAKKAAKYFCQAENVTSQAVAFIWSFFRPPWASGAMCCKRHVFNSIVKYCTNSEDADASILFSLGKVLSLHGEEEEEDAEEDCKSRANFWLEKAAQQGSSHAKFELWKQSTWSTNDPAVKLQRLRGLRECLPGNKEAELELVMNYASGNTGNLNREMAAMAIRQFLARSLPRRHRGIFQFQSDVNRTMRYILVDWLVEVSTMKNFSSHVLHVAVWYVDQYLSQRKSHRAQLQLLGIGCMLIASRFYGEDIVTIRESSWLTDNTYTYEQVVRMIGEIMGCLKGETQVLTIPNYVQIFCKLTRAERKVENFASYIADMSLLRENCGRYSTAVVALSCTLLGKLICYPESTWCQNIEIFLPFDKHLVLTCMDFLFEKCMVQDCLMDQQNVKLKAVKERYDTPRFSEVSKIKIPSKDEMKELIRHFSRFEEMNEPGEDTVLNTTLCSIASSGYDGDEEDLGDIGVIEDGDDEMMWCDDECLEQETKGDEEESPKNGDHDAMIDIFDNDQIERSTPSFLSPCWLNSTVNHSTAHGARSRSVGSNEQREGLSRIKYHSVGACITPSSIHSRRPLMEVNERQPNNSTASTGIGKMEARFRPIQSYMQGASENVSMNN